jgi:hypothetical protein
MPVRAAWPCERIHIGCAVWKAEFIALVDAMPAF